MYIGPSCCLHFKISLNMSLVSYHRFTQLLLYILELSNVDDSVIYWEMDMV